MAIVGVIFAIGVTGLRSVFNVGLKSAAGKMSATLRYLSNKAVTDHMYLRMVYDFEGQSYHVEESADPFVVSPEEESGAKKKEKGSIAEREGEESKTSSFTPSESKLLQPVKLPSGVFFKDVSVSYLKDKKTEGEAYTYFFPDGFATPTLINLRDEDDGEHFSIEVLPLSGRVKVTGEYRGSLSEEQKK